MAGLQQAKLIQARSRISQLEGEVSEFRRNSKRARIEEELQSNASQSEYLPRLHQLEQERCALLEELMDTKAQLHSTETQLSVVTAVDDLVSSSIKQNKTLKTLLSELQSRADSLESENAHLKTQLELTQQQAELESSGIEQLELAYARSIEGLQRRVKELENVESQLLHSKAKVKELERQLRCQDHDMHFARVMGNKVQRYDDKEREVERLTEENTVLKQHKDNVELLRYKLQSLQEQCEKQKHLVSEVATLQLENQRLQEQLAESEEGDSSQPAVQYRLSELQQREVVLVCQAGEMETKIRTLENTIAMGGSEVAKLKLKLEKEQGNSAAREQRIQRLERKLLFVTKERDGCVNVLQSYKQDTGVEGLLQERLAEIQQQLGREKERVNELEAELEVAVQKTMPKLYS